MTHVYPIRSVLLPLLLTALLAAPWSEAAHRGETEFRADTARLAGFLDERGAIDMPAVYAALDPDVRAYIGHVTTLANPFMEGRAPGTQGNRIAADYLEFWFRFYGLEPAFPDADDDESDGWTSYRQPFSLPGGWEATTQDLAYTVQGEKRTLRSGRDFNALGVGDGEASGPLTFVGYGIADGPDDYDSFRAARDEQLREARDEQRGDTDLSGRIAVVLRFEPSDAEGLSRWNGGRTGWSGRAAIDAKFAEITRRNAAGIILVNPPDTHDERADKILTASESSWRRVGLPVVHMSQAAADTLLRAADGRSLSELKRLADEPGAQAIHLRDSVEVSIATKLERQRIETDNVGGVIRGKGDLADEWIIIGAHYDHVGYGNFGSMGGRAAVGQIHPGADDNASGTSALLLLAERFSRLYADLDDAAIARSLLFMGFSAEESGLIGSRHYTRNPTLSADQINLMMNLDMVGRMRDYRVEVSGIGTAEGLGEIVQPIFDRSGLTVRSQRTGRGPSDHASFYRANIPVLFVFTGLHEQYHRPTDVASLINSVGAVKIVDLAQELVYELATMPEQLVFTSSGGGFRMDTLSREDGPRQGEGRRPGRGETTPADADGQPAEMPRRMGPRVRLGIQPAYGQEGSGVLLDGVSEGTAAAAAGLRAGDRIVTWDDHEIADIAALMQRLGQHGPDDRVVLGVQRDGQVIEVRVRLRANDLDDQ